MGSFLGLRACGSLLGAFLRSVLKISFLYPLLCLFVFWIERFAKVHLKHGFIGISCMGVHLVLRLRGDEKEGVRMWVMREGDEVGGSWDDLCLRCMSYGWKDGWVVLCVLVAVLDWRR